MSKRTLNEAIATSGVWIDYDPLRYLKHLQAQIGYRAGYCIYLSDAEMKRMADVIDFNEDRDTTAATRRSTP